jgi:O-antigen ligase
MSGAVLLTAFLSLSSGPLSVLVVQVGLLSWNWALRDNEMRWKLMWALVAAMWVAISLVSNQTVPEFLLTHFSFDQASAYYRVLIWHFGSMSVANHPLFGTGFGSWDRPDWMPDSIDMFWLYHAILFGLPAGILMMSSFLLTVLSVGFKKIADPDLARYRIAFLIVMTGYFLAGWTVHFWNATYVLFLFLMGSGAWLVDFHPEPDSAPVNPPRPGGRDSVSQRPTSRQPIQRTRQPSARPSRQRSGSAQ